MAKFGVRWGRWCRLGSSGWTVYLFPVIRAEVRPVIPARGRPSGTKREVDEQRLPDHLKRTTNRAEGRDKGGRRSGKDDGRMKTVWQKRDDESSFQKFNLLETRELCTKGRLHRFDMKISWTLRLKKVLWRRSSWKVEQMLTFSLK